MKSNLQSSVKQLNEANVNALKYQTTIATFEGLLKERERERDDKSEDVKRLESKVIPSLFYSHIQWEFIGFNLFVLLNYSSTQMNQLSRENASLNAALAKVKKEKVRIYEDVLLLRELTDVAYCI
jgi:hypothetical protein